ncbi:MAG: glutamate 5-kinase [Eubacteriales bacterium]|nr:glutamate 5-kinase [Eubacteriales bacterium]MDD3199597.1 glutamate 5-kinase [Eubacteriales bacterium]MDD4121779.1 glutamate 5-kinase [Eubacteriales bacterium]MDD4629309.1 glutamate 5-kinase [Eubacteriales bacterium]
MIGDLIHNSRKIVIKIGSNVLSDDNGFVNKESMQNIVEQVMKLIRDGKQVIIVSSGAGICGVAAINKWSRRGDINYKQALCAIGQVELMNAYKEFFGDYDIHVAQILLTRDDFGDHIRTLNIRNALFTLVDEGVVPIINENDSVSVEEIKIGDNDTLGALTANLWNADLLIVMSDIDGVFDKDPKDNRDAELIEEVYDTDGLLLEIDSRGKSRFGTGGIVTKIQAARRVNEYGIPMLLVNGKHKNILTDAAEGSRKGTIFFSQRR